MATKDSLFEEASTISPSEKAQLIDQLISTLDKPDKKIDELWVKEAEDRIDAYDQGKIKAISLEEVLQKYRQSNSKNEDKISKECSKKDTQGKI